MTDFAHPGLRFPIVAGVVLATADRRRDRRTAAFAALIILICTSAATTARAHESGRSASDAVSGYVALMSNYIGRGLSQSVGQPAVQAELDVNSGNGFYATLDVTSINWIDQLYPGDSASIEVDGIVGYRRTLAHDWTLKGGVMRLQFPGRYVPQSPPAARPDTTELFGAFAWRGLSAKFNYAVTDAFGTPDSRGSWYLDLSASVPVGAGWQFGAHLGRKHTRGTDPVTHLANSRFSYTDYKLSIARALTDRLSLTLAYAWADANQTLYTLNGYKLAGHHFAVTLEKDFD